MKQPLIIYWARRDLRLQDNPALSKAIDHATRKNIPFAPIFILEDYMVKAEPESQFGYPQRVFLSKALPQFIQQFPIFHLLIGKAAQTIIQLNTIYEIHLYVNEDIYPDFTKQITKIKESGISVHLYADTLTINPDTRTQTENLYSVFTPFKKAVWDTFTKSTLYPLADITKPQYASQTLLNTLSYLEPTEHSIWNMLAHNRKFMIDKAVYDLATYIPIPDLSPWYTSEKKALSTFESYLQSGILEQYNIQRDLLGEDGTSKMSLALAWGLVSARILCNKIQQYLHTDLSDINNPHIGANTYVSELIWREFYHYLLFHHPHVLDTEFQPKFRNTIQWISGKAAHTRFISWIQGKTGYPIVDAAMRQIAHTGWMHNRTRMVVASILTKNLGIDWRWGQEYFRATLIDLDEASNNGGWQWAASVGADPKPIRIFNPYLQAEKYDTNKKYQDTWLPLDYDIAKSPLITHDIARKEALYRYNLIKHKS